MKHSITYHNLDKDSFQSAKRTIKEDSKLQQYLDLLFWWNKRVNLFSRDVSRETMRLHIQHSLLLSGLEVFKTNHLIVDAGTGGGLPGIPLATTHKAKKFVLNDIVKKKTMAIKQMGRKLLLHNMHTFTDSIEDLQPEDGFLLISKHAFKVNELYNFTEHMPWDTFIMYKSTEFEKELQGIKDSLDIKVYKLFPNSDHSFYKGKGILIINR